MKHFIIHSLINIYPKLFQRNFTPVFSWSNMMMPTPLTTIKNFHQTKSSNKNTNFFRIEKL